MFRTLALAFGAATLCGCATPVADGSAAATRDCFRSLDIDGYGVIDDRRVRVSVSPRRDYILTIRRDTRDLDWANTIAIRSGTSFVCVGNGLGVELVGGDPPQRYPVVNIERAPQEAPAESQPSSSP
jgi:hypothetical protein